MKQRFNVYTSTLLTRRPVGFTTASLDSIRTKDVRSGTQHEERQVFLSAHDLQKGGCNFQCPYLLRIRMTTEVNAFLARVGLAFIRV